MSLSFLCKNTSTFVTNSPPSSLALNVCARGSNQPIKSSETLVVLVELETVLFSRTLWVSILPFLVAIISSWIVLKIPVEVKTACANVSGSGFSALVLEEVNLKRL